MALSRADTISNTLKKEETYSDFLNSFNIHPLNGELLTVKNEDSIKQAFKNLILTNIGERLFDPYFGSTVNSSLFEPYTPFLVEDVQRSIRVAASNFENRISILNISILDDIEKNAFSVTILFSIINRPDPVQLDLFLRRVR